MLVNAEYPITGHHYWVDRLNPWVVRFGNGFGIRWYGLAYLAGFVLAGWIFSRWAWKGRLPIHQEGALPLSPMPPWT
jgi:prolipoprotein diacylglyceryltransferase